MALREDIVNERLSTENPLSQVYQPKLEETPDPLPQDSSSYQTNLDGSYKPFDTVAADATRTAGGGFVDSVNPYYAATANSGPSSVQQMQTENINPALYGALSFSSYAQPEFANVAAYDYSGGGDPLSGGVQNLTAAQTAPTQEAFTGYVDRLEDTTQERAAAAVQNQQAWNTMHMTSPVMNGNGGNSYAIQHQTGSNIPLFNTNTGTREENVGVPKLATTGTSSGGSIRDQEKSLDQYAYNKGTQYNQFLNKPLKQNTGINMAESAPSTNNTRGTINFSKALWR